MVFQYKKPMVFCSRHELVPSNLTVMFRFMVLALAVASASAGLVLPRLPLNVLLRGDVMLVDPKIVGGTQAREGEFPWQVSLRSRSELGSAHFCGGSVGDEDTIITASHCVSGSSARSVYVAAGAYQLLNPSGNEQISVAASLTTHPDYNSRTFYNDVAIIKLETALTFNSFVQPVALPAAGQQTAPGTTVTVTGWGTTSEGGSLSNTLMKVDVPVVSDDDCRASYGQSDVADSMICAGLSEGGKDSCQGDSGGPLVNGAGELVGIVSWGYGCARPGYPGVYTETSYFIDWITSQF